jgi:hypothetical protein
MPALTTAAAWVLIATFAISFAYETSRLLVARDRSPYDGVRWYLRTLALDAVAAVIIVLLLVTGRAAVWPGLVFSLAAIAASLFYYAPVVMLERLRGRPALLDWLECLTYTGGLFAAAALLGYAVLL